MKKINYLVVGMLALLVGSQISGCNNKVQLEAVSDLKVTRVNDKWNVTFSGVENASTYDLTIKNGDVVVASESLNTTPYTMDPIVETGIFTFEVVTKGKNSSYIDSEVSKTTYEVHVFDNEVNNGVTFNGVSENNVPVGTFTVTYSDGAKYVGTLTENYLRDEGKLTYSNNMYYEGHFVNDLFEGEGMFTWSTTGDWHDSNTYVGQFKAGGFNDQIGTYYCSANWNRANDYGGLLYFSGMMGPTFGIAGKVGTTGKGGFQFANNSVYEGDLFVTGDWAYARDGFGFNKWIVNENSSWISGGSDSLLIHGFEGYFTKDAWIKGDGIWYFNDNNGNPYGYIKGNWENGTRLGDASSELVVRDEFKNTIEIKL